MIQRTRRGCYEKRLNLCSGIRESFLRELVFEVMKIILIHGGQKESEETDMMRTRVLMLFMFISTFMFLKCLGIR